MTDEFEYDPERAIWRPGRRTFLFMLGGAVAGAIVRPTLAQVEVLTGPARPRMVDPRQLWQATVQELHGDPSAAIRLGLEPFRQEVLQKLVVPKELLRPEDVV